MDEFNSIQTRDLIQDLFSTRDLTQIGTYGIRVDSRKLRPSHLTELSDVDTRRLVILSHNGERSRSGDTKRANVIPQLQRDENIWTVYEIDYDEDVKNLSE